MNRIKIIKRAVLQSPPEVHETAAKDVSQTLIKRRVVNVVENWIDERRASQPKDARRAFAALFGASPPVSG